MFQGQITKRSWSNYWRKIFPLVLGGLFVLALTGRAILALEAGLVFLVASFNFFLSTQATDLVSKLSKGWAEAAVLVSFGLRLILAAIFMVATYRAGLDLYTVALVYLVVHLMLSTMVATDFYLNFTDFSKEENAS